jgi:hypothetical protein
MLNLTEKSVWRGIWIHLIFSYPLFYKRNICRSCASCQLADRLLYVSFWRCTEFRTWKKSRNSVKFRGISRNYRTRNSVEFRRNFSQFRTEYGIDGSKKNRRNSVSTEFRGHPTPHAKLLSTKISLLLMLNLIRTTMSFWNSLYQTSIYSDQPAYRLDHWCQPCGLRDRASQTDLGSWPWLCRPRT